MSDYPSGMTLRPIQQWPGALTTDRRRSPFSATWRATLDLLDRELWNLGRGQANAPAVLQIAMREQDFRQDGMPRANALPAHPGVILSIDSRHGALAYPSDQFHRWQDNLRAIGLVLEALRKIDRYGVTPSNEQYTGWKQLEASAPGPPSFTVNEADEFLEATAKLDGSHDQSLIMLSTAQVYRRARKVSHPDNAATGSRQLFDRVEAAADALRAAGSLR